MMQMIINPESIVKEGSKMLPKYLPPKVKYEVPLVRFLEKVNSLGLTKIRDRATYLLQLGFVEEARRRGYKVRLDGTSIQLTNERTKARRR